MRLALALITHFVADFLLQSRAMGTKKSSNIKYLLAHIAIIFACFIPFGLKFAALNALIHMAIDASIWNLYKMVKFKELKKKTIEIVESHRGNIRSYDNMTFDEIWRKHPENYENFIRVEMNRQKESFKYYEDHLFYATIGFDQLLHTLTIVLLMGVL